MTPNNISEKMTENANKVAFLVQQYPEHSLTDIIALISLPAIDINVAIWTAQHLGYITQEDKETGKIELATPPSTWTFGAEVYDLQDMLVFAFGKLSKQERDLEQTYLSNWTLGHTSHDVIIAIADLINQRKLAQYTLEDKYSEADEDGETSTYTFTTLAENSENLWGSKQFKINPLTGEPNEDVAITEENTDEN